MSIFKKILALISKVIVYFHYDSTLILMQNEDTNK